MPGCASGTARWSRAPQAALHSAWLPHVRTCLHELSALRLSACMACAVVAVHARSVAALRCLAAIAVHAAPGAHVHFGAPAEPCIWVLPHMRILEESSASARWGC